MLISRNTIHQLFVLMVGVCLIGISLHNHDAIPSLHEHHQVDSHLTPDQPDCLACMQLAQALPGQIDQGYFIFPGDYHCYNNYSEFSLAKSYSQENNKSPPLFTKPRSKEQLLF